MMTDCLRISDMRWPTTRAMMSLGPPGGKGTISLIGLLGKSCAMADAGHSSVNPISSAFKALTSVLPRSSRVVLPAPYVIAAAAPDATLDRLRRQVPGCGPLDFIPIGYYS